MVAASRVFIIVLAFSLVVLSVFTLFPSTAEHSSSSEVHPPPPERKVPAVQHPKTGTRVPEGWRGLPISWDNPTYIDPQEGGMAYKGAYKALLKKLLLLSDEEYRDNDEMWETIATTYETLIGWNGIFDVMSEVFMKTQVDASMRFHSIGETLARHTKNPRHAVEIASRNILHKAPLHGCTWQYITEFGAEDTQALFDYVYNDLCYFRDDPDMGNVWISCAHGVGHGLGYIYEFDGIPTALDICSLQDDMQFQYACATGVFMSLEKDTPVKSFFPCDINRFHGACYRFKNRLFNNIFYDTPNPCSTQLGDDATLGCIWGFGYTSSPPEDFQVFCEPFEPEYSEQQPQSSFHAACVDGLFSGTPANTFFTLHGKQGCEMWRQFPESYDICIVRTTRNFQVFSFTDEDAFFYNDQLLDRFYDPSVPVPYPPAEWLHEWNTIPVHRPGAAQSDDD